MRSFRVMRMSQQWSAYPHFQYAIVYDRNSFHQSVRDFNKAIAWCWDSFESSIDLQSWHALRKSDAVNKLWCWDTQTNVHPNRIYLATSKEVDAFLLRWN